MAPNQNTLNIYHKQMNNGVTGLKYLQYAQKMISSVLLCFSGGTKSGLHAGGQIKSKANCTHFTIQHPMNTTEK